MVEKNRGRCFCSQNYLSFFAANHLKGFLSCPARHEDAKEATLLGYYENVFWQLLPGVVWEPRQRGVRV